MLYSSTNLSCCLSIYNAFFLSLSWPQYQTLFMITSEGWNGRISSPVLNLSKNTRTSESRTGMYESATVSVTNFPLITKHKTKKP